MTDTATDLDLIRAMLAEPTLTAGEAERESRVPPPVEGYRTFWTAAGPSAWEYRRPEEPPP